MAGAVACASVVIGIMAGRSDLRVRHLGAESERPPVPPRKAERSSSWSPSAPARSFPLRPLTPALSPEGGEGEKAGAPALPRVAIRTAMPRRDGPSPPTPPRRLAEGRGEGASSGNFSGLTCVFFLVGADSVNGRL